MSGQWRFSLFSFIFGFVLFGLAFGDDDVSNSTANPTDCSCCSSEDCDCCFAGYCDPLWTVRADGVLLRRSKPRDTILVTDQQTPGGTVLLNANEFDLGTSGGWDLSIIRHCVLGTQWGIEGLYYSVDNWYASRGVERSADGAWVAFETPIGNGAYPADISGVYRSGLHNAELNARLEIGDRRALLIGFRYLDLRENGLTIFQTVLATPPNPANYDIKATNQLSGIQVGFDGHIFSRGRLGLDGLIKAGIFNNSAGNDVAITQSVGPSYYSSANANHTAFVGELAFTGVYQLNEYWRVRGGYQLLWIQGVALASDQVAVSDPINGTATVNTNGCPFYHGAIVGLEFNY